MSISESAKTFVIVGSYAESSKPGIYLCRFDGETGSLELIQSVAGLQNPSFLAVDEQNRRLYAITEKENAEGELMGGVSSFSIDSNQPALTFLNQMPTVTSPTCHVNLDKTNQCLMVASYRGGMIGLSSIADDGYIGPLEDVHQHVGSSVLPIQNQPHPHSVFIDPSNRYAIVPDLGLDLLKIYILDIAARKLIPHGQVCTAPGAGPRHFIFHPELPYGYVINELNGTITVFFFDVQHGTLTELQTIATLPDSYQGENSCADIHISPDGRFLYGSNRGHDSIVVYEIDRENGHLQRVEHVSTLGEHPRNFALSPDGRFLLVANKNTNNIVTFNRDAASGKLTATGQQLELSEPVCIKFSVLS
jgi:6-phosphogluconolactonase